MEREKDIPSLSEGWVVHLFTYRSQACWKDCERHPAGHAYWGVGGENECFPASMEQVERKALKFSVRGHGAALARGLQGMKGQEKGLPLTAPDHLWSDILMFFRGCI